MLGWSDPGLDPPARATMWTGAGNVYLVDTLGDTHVEGKSMPLDWAGWRAYWGAAETGGRWEAAPRLAYTAPVREDVADRSLDRSIALIRDLWKRHPNTGANPDRLFGTRQ